MYERTLVIIKPDAIARKIIGKILSRLEDKDLQILEIKSYTPCRAVVEAHCSPHKSKDFFGALVASIALRQIIVLIVCGEDAVAAVRDLAGASGSYKNAPGTIRGDFANHFRHNVVHASDSVESAACEIAIWFPDFR